MDRWEKIEDAYHGAHGLHGHARSRLLAARCGSDDAMRQQVEALLAQDEAHDSFFPPALDLAAAFSSDAGGAVLTGGRVGAYEILELVGSGGMGDVYRARDTMLDRDVALKVLPESFARDPVRLARFKRESQVLASLNHPNIATIHGFEESDATRALVMELVDGPTLADRIARGPIPLEEGLPIARQIAEALEAAHQRGIVHRDLKPANIKIRPDGTVKVLDFGLAKVLEPVAPTSAGETASPIYGVPMSEAGIILGTAAYMSPEQARGQVVDKRADIWAFGVMLYEMVSGRRLFARSTTSDTLASVLKEEPDWGLVPAEAQTLLRRCLEKDPKHRLRDIGDATPLLGLTQGSASDKRGRLVTVLGWSGCALFGLAAAALAAIHFREAPPLEEPTRFQIPLLQSMAQTSPVIFSVSPDGRQIAFFEWSASETTGRYWLRALDSLEARELKDSENDRGGPPFWSADSRFLIFQAGDKLKKIDVMGGPARTLCEIRTIVTGGSANRDGVIIFGTINGGVMRVSDAGGDATALTTLDASRSELAHSFPVFLADGRHFLYLRESANLENSGLYSGSLDVTPSEQVARRLVATSAGASYVQPARAGPGQLLFVREGALLAQPFDDRDLKISGDPLPLADQVQTYFNFAFSTSSNGVLVYRRGATPKYQLTWLDNQGHVLRPLGEPDFYRQGMTLSPDGTRAVVMREEPGITQSMWLLDLARAMRTRFTSGTYDASPVWSPDSTRVAFLRRSGSFALYVKAVNGATEEPLLAPFTQPTYPTSWSPDARMLLYATRDPKTKDDIWVVPLEGNRQPKPLLHSDFNESWATFSPDGRWIAYVSDESGRNEIYVQEFSSASPTGFVPGGATWLISRGIMSGPVWRFDSKQLAYVSSDMKHTVVEVTPNRDSPFGEPNALFTLPQGIGGYPTADLRRVLVALPVAESSAAPFTVVLNWPALLKK